MVRCWNCHHEIVNGSKKECPWCHVNWRKPIDPVDVENYKKIKKARDSFEKLEAAGVTGDVKFSQWLDYLYGEAFRKLGLSKLKKED